MKHFVYTMHIDSYEFKTLVVAVEDDQDAEDIARSLVKQHYPEHPFDKDFLYEINLNKLGVHEVAHYCE